MMKCISLWQPWASLIVIGAKQFETRSWSTSYRGPLLIHAAQKWDLEQRETCINEPFSSALGGDKFPNQPQSDWFLASLMSSHLPRGCIIGMVELVDCYQVFQTPLLLRGSKKHYVKMVNYKGGKDGNLPLPTGNELAFGDFSVGRYAWKLSNPVRFAEPIPYRGMQQIFNVPDDVVAEQLAKARAA